ncbi:magnesium-dependent phosphatase-1 [Pelagicoccus sp. NFK12]|uniref:Magnesium-dependent phosphatase-1 n=1 Tax=Pelagicoccus enzymogenes TaxID=2773457 RepID=A0A927FB54_9BACT|nr:magnesium-dependent phosphatase-1 [Pelagicoccus enzymogenes]MBD5781150.1 magnesium-dependent phosphatase-1 [Pelagicoccus enzymogenes]
MKAAREFKLVVFDLDFTLWDAGGVWCDCLQPPFSLRDGKVRDASGAVVRVYEEIPPSLRALSAAGFELGIASRTTQPSWARSLLDLLKLRDCFAFEEIYPSSKVRHFAELKAASGYDYGEMLFFDDELRNVEEVGELGVRCVHVRNGFRRALLDAEISLFQ